MLASGSIFPTGTFLKISAAPLKSLLFDRCFFAAVELRLFIVVTTTSMNSFGLNDLILTAAANSACHET